MNNEQLQILKDPKLYLEKFCKIKTKEHGMQPFVLNNSQRDLYNTLRKKSRVILLKARQLGMSTAVTGYLYHKTIMTPGTNTALIGYNSDLTAELLDKVKTFIQSTPPELRPTIQYNSKYEISFPKINSKILVLPSTDNVGRGYTLHNVLLTELAFWEKAEDKMMALEASVPLNGQIIVESTPNGLGNCYHKTWVSDNGYAKKEYGWRWGYSEEEIEVIRKRMNNPQKFAQEYELEFLSSGRPVFDPYALKRQRKNILRVGDVHKDVHGRTHIVKVEDDLRIYKEPELGGMYVFGGDVAEGIDGGDYTTCIVWDRRTGEEVAFFKGLMSPDVFGEKLNRWGRKYNDALMVVEINNHGLTTLTILRQLMYPSLYFRQTHFEKIHTGWTDKLGWKTTKLTRPLLIDDLAQALRDDLLVIHSKELLDEMTVMVYDKSNNANAPRGQHDDTIFAAGVGYQGFKVLFNGELNQINYERELPSGSFY